MLTDTHRRVQLILKDRLNNTQIAKLTNCSRNTVTKWRTKLTNLNLDEKSISALSENDLRRLVTPGAFARHKSFERPDFDKVIFEANERGVRLKTLYGEYVDSLTDPSKAMALTTFYRNISAVVDRQDVVLTFNYEAGEMIQVDFVGRKRLKQPVLLDAAGEEIGYEIFCAASAKSRKTFLLAISSQAKLPVLGAFAKMFAFFEGVPVLVTIDNFKAAVSEPRRGTEEATITPEFVELSAHYGFGLVAARVRKPRDKGIVENAVGIVQDDVLALLRNRQFFSLPDMNAEFAALVEKLNDRPMKTHQHASRNDLFARGDHPGFEALPLRQYEPGKYFVRLRAGRDYHVTVYGTRYSVPHRFAGSIFDVKATEASIHLICGGKVIATHKRIDNHDQLVTTHSHMPKSHKDASMTRLHGMKRYVSSIGENAQGFIDAHFRSNKRPHATAKAATTLEALAKEYPAQRVNTACGIALTVGKPTINKVKSILASGVDQSDNLKCTRLKSTTARKNVRGADYFSDLIEDAMGEQSNG